MGKIKSEAGVNPNSLFQRDVGAQVGMRRVIWQIHEELKKTTKTNKHKKKELKKKGNQVGEKALPPS